MNHTQDRVRLPTHEWFAVVAISGFILIIASISFATSENEFNADITAPHHLLAQHVVVNVKGKVRHPGRYQVERGTTVRDVLNLAEMLPEANLKGIKLRSKVREGQTITVRARK